MLAIIIIMYEFENPMWPSPSCVAFEFSNVYINYCPHTSKLSKYLTKYLQII